MKRVGKAVCVLLSLVMVLTFAACGGGALKEGSPSYAVDKALQEFKTQLDVDKYLEQMDMDDLGMDVEDLKPWLKMLQEFEYEIGEEKVKGDTAEVTVTITTYAFGKAMEGFFDQLITIALSNPDVTEQELIDTFMDSMTSLKTKDYTKEVVIICEKRNGEWVPDLENNEDFIDAILGGILTAIEEFTKMFQ